MFLLAEQARSIENPHSFRPAHALGDDVPAPTPDEPSLAVSSSGESAHGHDRFRSVHFPTGLPRWRVALLALFAMIAVTATAEAIIQLDAHISGHRSASEVLHGRLAGE